jgi:hypothetical protein
MKLLLLVLAAFLLASTQGLVIQKTLRGNQDQYYIGRFVFTNNANASLQEKDGVWINYNARAFGANSYWALFFDSFWFSVYHNKSKSCQEKVDVASFRWQVQANNKTHNVSVHTVVHDFIRPHAWFLVLLNCPVNNVVPAVDVDYTAIFRDIDGGHVGYDEKGVMAIYATFFTFFFILAVVHSLGDVFLWLRNSFHHIVKLLLVALVLMVFANTFNLIHWAKYQGDGIGCTRCSTLGSFLDDTAYIFFTILLLMIASGWAITYQTLTRRWIILALFIANALAVIILYIIAATSTTDTTAATVADAYAYTTSVGVATLLFGIFYFLVWGATVAYFVFAVFTSYRDEAQFDKRVFYMIFGISYLCWFVVVPLFSLISIALVAWLRLRMMVAIHQVITIIGMGVLVVLLWPSFVYKYFRVISPDLLTDNPGGI